MDSKVTALQPLTWLCWFCHSCCLGSSIVFFKKHVSLTHLTRPGAAFTSQSWGPTVSCVPTAAGWACCYTAPLRAPTKTPAISSNIISCSEVCPTLPGLWFQKECVLGKTKHRPEFCVVPASARKALSPAPDEDRSFMGCSLYQT